MADYHLSIKRLKKENRLSNEITSDFKLHYIPVQPRVIRMLYENMHEFEGIEIMKSRLQSNILHDWDYWVVNVDNHLINHTPKVLKL